MIGRWTGWALALGLAFGLWACDDDDGAGGGCKVDNDCTRGQICEDGSCSVIQCGGIGNCPGSGRTCLLDLRQCSPKECADVVNGAELACPPERSICIEDGAFRASCVADAACEGPADCAPFGDGFACCDGQCSEDCPDMGMLPVEDMSVPMPDGGAGGDGGAGPDMGAPGPDMGPMPTGELCSPCGSDEDCANLGEGARCTALGADGAFCASSCLADDACPTGYQCVRDGLDLCLPAGLRCVECLRNGCPAGESCDTNTGECVAPRGVCGACADDNGCLEGLSCGVLGNSRNCFEACADGQCPDDFMCEGGQCKPVSGMCDACGGSCGGDTPYCVEASGRCGQCGPGSPCPEGLSCDIATNSCVEREGCLGDIDCQNPDLSVCFNGQCVACLQDTDCPPRTACSPEQACVPDLCRGVECGPGAQCDDESGRCEPGCQVDADCVNMVDARMMACNGQTGQCYYTNGTCDVGQGPGVCAPGSTCTVSFFDPNLGVCDCQLTDPANPASEPRIACQPGMACSHPLAFIDPTLPGCCGGCGFAK